MSSPVSIYHLLPTLRRLAPVLGMLMAVLVFAQVTDLAPCADETPDRHASADYHVDALAPQGAHPVQMPGGNHDEGHDDALADCLCHVVFAPMAALPLVPAQPGHRARYAPWQAAAPDMRARTPDHVPLG
jgi:hypothetical protein